MASLLEEMLAPFYSERKMHVSNEEIVRKLDLILDHLKVTDPERPKKATGVEPPTQAKTAGGGGQDASASPAPVVSTPAAVTPAVAVPPVAPVVPPQPATPAPTT